MKEGKKSGSKKWKKVALVVGATGTAGHGVVDYLLEKDDWQVLALSRAIKEGHKKNLVTIKGDLLEPRLLESQLKGYEVTHLFYLAMERDHASQSLKLFFGVRFIKFWLRVASFFLLFINFLLIPPLRGFYFDFIDKLGGASDLDGKNSRMFQNITHVLEKTSSSLSHIGLISGGKYYGIHLGPSLNPSWKIPFEEDDPRYFEGKNYYFKMEDFLKKRAEEKAYNWTILRTNFIVGFSEGSPYNLGPSLAIYAVLLKELNLPLIFPGDRKTYKATWEVCSSTGLGRMFEWAVEKNEVFNYTSGCPFSWEDVWPKLAEYFCMTPHLKKGGFSCHKFFKKNGHLWEIIAKRHNLKGYKLSELANPDFIDNSMILDWNVVYSMKKAKKYGYAEEEDPSKIFLDLFNSLKEKGVIPS